jgi:hypothetical protein
MVSQEDVLREFLMEADRLSREEYKQPIEQLVAELDTKLGQLRYGRLLGVMLKEPMSQSLERSEPSKHTGAWRDWGWDPQKTADAAAIQSWQYQLLSELAKEQSMTVEEFVQREGLQERKIFLHLMRATRKYICNNQKAKKEIQRAIEDAKKQGIQITNLTNQGAGVVVAGLVSGALVTVLGPWAIALGPLAGGLTLLLMAIGTEAFCTWSEEKVIEVEIAETAEQRRVKPS